MNDIDYSTLTDEELLESSKKLKRSAITSALLIGLMIGIIIYSVLNHTIGLVTLIPLFFVYRMVKNDKKNQALREELKKRGLK